MQVNTPESLSSLILAHTDSARTALFAGAGISARLQVPTWGSLLRRLGDVCREFGDNTSGLLIDAKIDDRDFLGAAAIYNLCKRIPAGERYKRLVEFLSPSMGDSDLEKLRPLMEVGFSAIITTNFDRVLHNTYAYIHRRSPIHLELDDDSLKSGATLSDFYIARIHGRVEKPESILLDEHAYSNVENDPRYKDFVIGALSYRPCCFIGFSFSDPAISRVIGIFRDKFGSSNYPALHLAILPASAGSELINLLGTVNIRVAFYDEKDDHHDLWHALRLAATTRISRVSVGAPADPLNAHIAQFKRLTAFSFAQLTTREAQAPLLESTRKAVVLSVIENGGTKGHDDIEYHKETAGLLHISQETAKTIFVEVSSRLIASGLVERKAGRLIVREKYKNIISDRLSELAKTIIDRVRVMTGLRLTDDDAPGICDVIEKIFFARAWDLAAYYAGSKIGYPADITVTVEKILREEAAKKRIAAIQAIGLAICDLLHRPTDHEATILSDVGRAAFAVQLMLSAPRQSAFARFVIPTRIYFDSNVAMPAVVDGHPMQPMYWQAIRALTKAAERSKTPLELVVPYQFANEIVSHRQLGIQIVSTLGLDDPGRLRKFVTIYGAHNGNVFVGAFSVEVGRAERPVKFADFLARVAPYTNEGELKEFLKTKGLTVLVQDPARIEGFEKTKTLLLNGYSHGYLSGLNSKDGVLVAHEAAQLATLMQELGRGDHSIFVTADLRLANVIYSDNYLKQTSGAILTHWGFVGLVDLLIGVNIDSQSFARLVWGNPEVPDEIRLRDYLLQRSVAEYDASLLRRMPDVLTKTLEMAKAEVRQSGIRLGEENDLQGLVKTRDVMDRVENYYFENMRDAIEKMEEQEMRKR